LISVIVPAHNEEAAIEGCLRSVLAQDYPRFELILVDDRSEDGTRAIADALAAEHDNLTVVSSTELPPGWTGKCHAINVGTKHARGEWLAFLDADSQLHPCALTQCYHRAVTTGVNMVSLTPGLVLTTFWDKALQPVFAGLACVIFPLSKVNDQRSKVASANGMFFVISRKAYEAIGGHHDVKDLAVEDIGIGKRVKAAGLGLTFAIGRRVLRTKMYTGALESMRGWTRILAAAMNYQLPSVLWNLATNVLISLPVIALALLVYLPRAVHVWPSYWFVLPAFLIAEVSIGSLLFYPLLGAARSYSLLMSIGNLVLVGVLGNIVKKILWNDALQWRGTTYETSRYEPKRLDPAPSRFTTAETLR
jgi:chlorobactene glucosyltransferase